MSITLQNTSDVISTQITAIQQKMDEMRLDMARFLLSEMEQSYIRLDAALIDNDRLRLKRKGLVDRAQPLSLELSSVSSQLSSLTYRIRKIEAEIQALKRSSLKKSFIKDDLQELFLLQKALMDHTHDIVFPAGQRLEREAVTIRTKKAHFMQGAYYSKGDEQMFYPLEISPKDYEV